MSYDDPANEVECPECGTVHFGWPRRLCNSCKADYESEKADYEIERRKEERF